MFLDNYEIAIKKEKHPKVLYSSLAVILEESRSQAFTNNNEVYTQKELEKIVVQTSLKLGFDLTSSEKDEILSYLEADNSPYGILQPLVDDLNITDIIIKAFNSVSIQYGRRNISTNISFISQSSYETFVEKILYKANTTYSTKQPIADGVIDSFARIHAVHSSICEEGPYLTIRLNRFENVTIQDLIKLSVAPSEIFEYLSQMIQLGNTILIVGEVGTGKTTLARALGSLIPQDESILLIEDTPEIYLMHKHVRAIRTRESNSEGNGSITPAECIKAGMRMSMNRIIFGEIRDAKAAESFIDVCASGHPGVSTIHAKNANDAITRLELFLGRAQPGVERSMVSEQIATAVQIIIFVDLCKSTKKRRIFEIRELSCQNDKLLRYRTIFKYIAENGDCYWDVVTKISNYKERIDNKINLAKLKTPLRA